MAGLAPKLPLLDGQEVGYDLLQTLDQVVHQNLKNLLLTAPGERVMDPNFGVGLRLYLFELDTRSLRRDINKRIRQQVSIYLPFVNLINISIFDPNEETAPVKETGMSSNVLRINVTYKIVPLGLIDTLELDLQG